MKLGSSEGMAVWSLLLSALPHFRSSDLHRLDTGRRTNGE